MKKHELVVLLLIPILFAANTRIREKEKPIATDQWSGMVSFFEKKTGSEGLYSEWKMFAFIFRDTGTAVHTANITSNNGWSRCRTTEKTYLELGIDEENKIYSISVQVPGCYGRQVIKGIEGEYGHTDETAIVINNQRLPQDRNVLTGSTSETHTDEFGSTTTIYQWTLRKLCPLWNNPLTQTSINTLDPVVKAAATRFINRVNDELCIRVKITEGYRSDAKQEYEYSKGRTISSGIDVTPDRPLGKPVTYARAGESNHSSGKAIDVYYATSTGIDKDKVLAPEIVEIARQEGFAWGGYWKGDKRDPPHFEYKPEQ